MPDPSPRYDLYAPIHKALRAFMADTLTLVGRSDPDDSLDLQEAVMQVRALLEVLNAHLEHENEHVHPALEDAVSGSSRHIADDHIEHARALFRLHAQTDALVALPLGQRHDAALALYRELAVFVAHNFEHMHYEEIEHGAVLRSAYHDAQLRAIEQRIVASQSPEQMALTLRWMLPYLHHGERSAMLLGMRAGMPAALFDNVLVLARTHLRPRDWAKLQVALDPALAA